MSFTRTHLWAAVLMSCLLASADITLATAQAPESPLPRAPESQSSDATRSETGEGAETSGPSPTSTHGAAERVQYVGPDTYILRDAQGRPQSLLGMTYEDFLAAWKRLQQVDEAADRARFAIDRVVLKGRAHDRHAVLDCEIRVRLLSDESVEVPLGMIEAILQGEAQFTPLSEGDMPGGDNSKAHAKFTDRDYLDYDPQRGGFVARFAAGSSQSRSLSLTLLVPLLRDAAGSTLSLTCPRTASSSLTLDVGAAVSDIDASTGVLTAQETTRDGTRLIVAGAIGPFRLTWRTPDARGGSFATVLNAQGAIRVAIDGRSVRTNARLSVASYGGSFDQLRVQLPRGAQLIQDRTTQSANENPGYRVSLEPVPSNKGPATGELPRQIAVVEFAEKQRGPVTIDLVTEQPIGLEAESSVEVSGMEVLGAVRQFGDVVLHVAPDWQGSWDVGAHVRQVDPAEIDSMLQQPNMTAAFQYDREPWSLAVRVAPRSFRVLVTPEYRLTCSPDEARLTVRLIYQVLGARAFGFRVNLKGWELTAEPVESGGLVDTDRIFVTPSGVLELPLAQALSRRAEINFTVQRVLERGDQPIRLPLPVPIADSVSPGELSVRTTNDIELVPDLGRSTGLTPRYYAEPQAAATTDMESEYDFRTSGVEAVFAAERVLRSREVSHDISTSIVIDDNDAHVEQQINYDVRHESIQDLKFEVPAELRLDATRPEISLVPNNNGSNSEDLPVEIPLGLVPQAEDQQSGATAPVSAYHATLPQSRLGTFSVLIRYQVDRPENQPPAGGWQLPLFQPMDGELRSHRAACQRSPQLSVSLRSSPTASTWKQTSTDDSNSNSTEEFLTTRPQAQLPLIVQSLEADSPAETLVDRVWLQTWVSGDVRQERAVFRIRSAGTQVAVELAPQTPDALEIMLDGERASVVAREPGRVVVAVSPPPAEPDRLPGNGAMMPHTLELRYRIPIRTALLTRHVMTPHQIVGRTSLAESYWQIVLPTDTHLIRSPAQMTAASVWQWLGSFWGRRPIRTQQELEGWTGATTQGGTSHFQNEYLFTGLAPVSTMQFVTAPRWLIVLIASASALGLALACLYVPAMRRLWVLGALACLLAGLALAFPTAALLLAQASAMGLALAVLAACIARLVARPATWGVVIPASGTHREIIPRAESHVVPSVAAAASTAPTVPLRVPEAE